MCIGVLLAAPTKAHTSHPTLELVGPLLAPIWLDPLFICIRQSCMALARASRSLVTHPVVSLLAFALMAAPALAIPTAQQTADTKHDLHAHPTAVHAKAPAVPDFTMQGPYATLARVTSTLAVQIDSSTVNLGLFVTTPVMHGQAVSQGVTHSRQRPTGAAQHSSTGNPSCSQQHGTAAEQPGTAQPREGCTQIVDGHADGSYPAAVAASAQPQPLPLLLMFNGFQMPASYYTTFARRLASWGYCVLQYNLPGLLLKRIVRDDLEV